MNDEARPPIVIKRIKKVAGGHHGGAWKIAYADFVTAMMAFFLLMWLIGSTAEGDRKGIAEYFQTPLRVAMAGGSGSGDSSSILKGGGENLSRTCSMGWAAFPWFTDDPKAVDYNHVLSLADRALNQAKRSGKNRAIGMLPASSGSSVVVALSNLRRMRAQNKWLNCVR